MSRTPGILLIDDSEDDGLLVARELRRALPQARIQRVDNEHALRDTLRDADWDVVVSDHSMPSFDSVRALEVLREVRGETPFIVYSGQYDQRQGLEAMNLGAQDFVYKSDDPRRLVQVVRRELRNEQTRRAKEEAEQAARHSTLFDGLTGLPNQQSLTQRVQACTDAARPVAVLCVNLDRFMRINDYFGAATGDALLLQIAGRIEKALGAEDVLARWGSDSFSVLLKDVATLESARARATQVLGAFSAPFHQNGQELFLTASMGCALYPIHGQDAATLLGRSESAMAAAKRNGRNRVEMFDPSLQRTSGRNLQIESELHHAIEREELFLVYQPIVHTQDARIAGAEALLRWQNAKLGMVPPDQFIPVADEAGHIIPIGEWVLRRACRQACRWHSLGHTQVGIAVNFSAAQFRDPRAVARVRSALEDSGLPPEALKIEITETVAMQDAESTIATLRALKGMGVRLAIDDFGTGYSSLSYLRRFPIDVLKIDRSFVKDIAENADNLSIVRTIVALAHTLRIAVVAEGVETAEQARLLAEERVDRAQGYFYARPMRIEDLLAKLHQPQDAAALQAA